MANYTIDKIEYGSNIYILQDSGALQLTGGNVTGPVNFGDSVSIDDLTAGSLVVSGSASVANNLQVNTINGVAVGNSPKFTDTNYYHTSGSWNGLTYTASAQGGAPEFKFTIPTGTSATTVAPGNHTHTLSLVTDTATKGTVSNNSTSSITLSHGGQYKLTAGGDTLIFTMPAATTYTLSGLGGVGSVSASGTAPLTLSASKSGTAVTITGSVADASASAKGVVTTGTQSFKGDKTFQSNTFRIRNENNDNNQAGSNPWITQLNLGDGNYVTVTEYKDDHVAIRGGSIIFNTDSAYSVYDATKTYSVGNIVWYNKAYYRCTTAITTAEAWTAEHWTLMPTSGVMSNANLNPWKDNTYSLGTSSYRWSDVRTVKLNGVEVPSSPKFTDTVYTHPTYTSYSSGLYKITINNLGHVISATAMTKADITGLGIPGTDYYHTSGSWNGLTYTATANGGAGALAFTIPTGTTATTVAVGNHTHSEYAASSHTHNYVPWLGNLTSLGSGTPAEATRNYWTNSIPNNSVNAAYNTSGTEYSLLFSRGGSASYGSILKWGYNDLYLYLLRMGGGSWKNNEWEKISAGYADSAGSVAWVNVSGKPTATGNAKTNISIAAHGTSNIGSASGWSAGSYSHTGFSGGSFTRGAFTGGSLVVNNHVLSFTPATHAADSFTAASYGTDTFVKPTLTITSTAVVTSDKAGHSITDDGHTHNVFTHPV